MLQLVELDGHLELVDPFQLGGGVDALEDPRPVAGEDVDRILVDPVQVLDVDDGDLLGVVLGEKFQFPLKKMEIVILLKFKNSSRGRSHLSCLTLASTRISLKRNM